MLEKLGQTYSHFETPLVNNPLLSNLLQTETEGQKLVCGVFLLVCLSYIVRFRTLIFSAPPRRITVFYKMTISTINCPSVSFLLKYKYMNM